MSNRENLGGNNPTIKDFVLQEAHERAFEISVLSLKDYEKQRAKIITQRKQAHQKQFDKKRKQAQAFARVHKSSMINGSRMTKMRARHNDLMNVVAQSQFLLKSRIVQNNQQYTQLMKKLILQGLIKMLEPIVLVRCLQRDKELVKSIIPQVKRNFTELISQQGIDPAVGNVDLRVDDRFYLIQRNIGQNTQQKLSKSDESSKCFGGVILTNQDGLIVCKNTIDSRIQLAYQHMLPTIRQNLFP